MYGGKVKAKMVNKEDVMIEELLKTFLPLN
jgi:hypothetical protein